MAPMADLASGELGGFGGWRSMAFLEALFVGAAVADPIVWPTLFRGGMRHPTRPLVPARLDQVAEPSKIPIPRARMATAGMAAQEALDNVHTMGERNASGDPSLRSVMERERRAKAMPAVNAADPAAVRREIQILDQGHSFPLLQPAEAISLRWAWANLNVDRHGDEFCQQIGLEDFVGRWSAIKGLHRCHLQEFGRLSPNSCRGRSIASTAALGQERTGASCCRLLPRDRAPDKRVCRLFKLPGF